MGSFLGNFFAYAPLLIVPFQAVWGTALLLDGRPLGLLHIGAGFLNVFIARVNHRTKQRSAKSRLEFEIIAQSWDVQAEKATAQMHAVNARMNQAINKIQGKP